MVSDRSRKVETGAAKRDQPLPQLEPGREVGWIFKDGEAVAIDRQEGESEVQPEPD